MKIAVNYSAALISLLTAEPELPVDFIKVPLMPFPGCWGQFEKGELHRKLLPHLAQVGVLAVGHPDDSRQFNPAIVQKALNWANPPYLSTHLEAQVEFLPEHKEFQHQKPLWLKEALKKHFLARIANVKQRLDTPLVLENYPYYTWWRHYRWGSAPEFITEVCREGGCQFLLDTAHARCSAWHMQEASWDYIKALPLKSLREVHITGVQLRRAEGLRDTHTMPDEEDFQLLERLLAEARPEIITIEYGGLPERILNIRQEYEPISRNNSEDLRKIIARVGKILGR